MDYGYNDVLSTSQEQTAADASLVVTYGTKWGCPEDLIVPSGLVLIFFL